MKINKLDEAVSNSVSFYDSTINKLNAEIESWNVDDVVALKPSSKEDIEKFKEFIVQNPDMIDKLCMISDVIEYDVQPDTYSDETAANNWISVYNTTSMILEAGIKAMKKMQKLAEAIVNASENK